MSEEVKNAVIVPAVVEAPQVKKKQRRTYKKRADMTAEELKRERNMRNAAQRRYYAKNKARILENYRERKKLGLVRPTLKLTERGLSPEELRAAKEKRRLYHKAWRAKNREKWNSYSRKNRKAVKTAKPAESQIEPINDIDV